MAQAQQMTYNNPVTRGLPQQFKLSSPAFADGGAIPKRHTADAENVSPLLTWGEPPEGTESFALICEDPDAPNGVFVHWLMWNIPREQRELHEGMPRDPQLPPNHIHQGQNGFGNTGYGGPRPPPGAPHRYIFRVYALDTRLELKPGSKRADFDRAIEAHVLGEATLIGKYGRGSA